MMKINTISRIQSVIEDVKTTVRRFIVPEIRHDEAARVHRCTIASEQAIKDLERIKTGGKSDSYRPSFIR